MAYPKIIPLIDALPETIPFVGPETIERRRQKPFIARLGANESAFGPSPRVIKAIQEEAANIWQYGDPENYELKQALASFYKIKPENITIGAGVDALLGLIVRQYIQPGDVVINSLGGYPTFNYHVAGFGGTIITVPYKDDAADLMGLAEAARTHKAKIVYLANPDNPLGTWHTASVIEAFLDAVPEDILVILDEAYCEMAPQSALPPFLPMRNNVLRTRTFSKAYGLAGARCGYAIGTDYAITSFDKIRDHFSINRLTQCAALAALKDQNYLASTVIKIAKARERITAIAEAHGLRTLPSATNFVAIDCKNNGAFAARVLDELMTRDIFVRKPTAPVLDRLIRVSTAPDNILDHFEKAFGPALKAARQERG